MKQSRLRMRWEACLSIFLVISLFFTVTINSLYAAEQWSTVNPQTDVTSSDGKLKQKVSLDYKDADLVNVLRSFAWTYNLNIVTSPEVKGKVTITLRDITAEKALEAILTVNGLAYDIREDVIYVSPGDTNVVELANEVIFLKYIKAADAQALLRKILSAKGDIKTDQVQNSLIITDYAANIRKLKELLKKIDIAPQQILIEAKIVDVTSTDLRQLGVTWNVEYAPGHGLFGRHTEYAEEADFTINMPEQSSDLPGSQFVLNALSLKGLTATATVDALVRDGKANLLASPSIAVLNGREARIIIGERYPIKERTQTTTGTTETTKFVDIGTTLKVTPQINDDGYITMRVHPEVSSLEASLDAGPRITTREADTTVRIKQGETLVIGGLIKQQDSRSKDKIPFLGDIPFVGLLFSRSEDDIEQKELAVFITPKILHSREELALLGRKDVEKESVYVNITNTGELAAVEEIFRKARNLERNRGIESRRKSMKIRKAQAVNLYENIYSQYPNSVRAPEAMYKAGMLYYNFYKNYRRAKETFGRLISDFSDSNYADKASYMVDKIERIEARQKRQAR